MFTFPYAYTVLDIYIGGKRRSTSGIPPLLRTFVGKRVDGDKASQSFNKRLERTFKRAGTLEEFLANLFADRGQDTGSLMDGIISNRELGFGEGRREELTERLQAFMLAHAGELQADPDLVPWQTFSPSISGLIGGIRDPNRRGTLQVWLDEILRLEQLSATSMRDEVNLRSEAVLSELACRPSRSGGCGARRHGGPIPVRALWCACNADGDPDRPGLQLSVGRSTDGCRSWLRLQINSALGRCPAWLAHQLWNLLRRHGSPRAGKVPILPGFVLVFLGLAIANTALMIPATAIAIVKPLTNAALMTAIAAVGIRTSIPAVLQVGPGAILTVLLETLFLLGFVVLCLQFALQAWENAFARFPNLNEPGR